MANFNAPINNLYNNYYTDPPSTPQAANGQTQPTTSMQPGPAYGGATVAEAFQQAISRPHGDLPQHYAGEVSPHPPMTPDAPWDLLGTGLYEQPPAFGRRPIFAPVNHGQVPPSPFMQSGPALGQRPVFPPVNYGQVPTSPFMPPGPSYHRQTVPGPSRPRPAMQPGTPYHQPIAGPSRQRPATDSQAYARQRDAPIRAYRQQTQRYGQGQPQLPYGETWVGRGGQPFRPDPVLNTDANELHRLNSDRYRIYRVQMQSRERQAPTRMQGLRQQGLQSHGLNPHTRLNRTPTVSHARTPVYGRARSDAPSSQNGVYGPLPPPSQTLATPRRPGPFANSAGSDRCNAIDLTSDDEDNKQKKGKAEATARPAPSSNLKRKRADSSNFNDIDPAYRAKCLAEPWDKYINYGIYAHLGDTEPGAIPMNAVAYHNSDHNLEHGVDVINPAWQQEQQRLKDEQDDHDRRLADTETILRNALNGAGFGIIASQPAPSQPAPPPDTRDSPAPAPMAPFTPRSPSHSWTPRWDAPPAPRE